MEIIRVTVDALIVEKGRILLIRRAKDPYRDFWALPGGFVEYGETVENAVTREAKEETALDCEIVSLVGVYSAPDRDPRGHTISVAYLMKVRNGALSAADDAKDAFWFDINELPERLAFDHSKIIENALK